MAKCVMCLKDDDQQLVCLREKCCKGINDAAQKRGDKLCTEAGQYVYSKCREVYINEFSIKKNCYIEISSRWLCFESNSYSFQTAIHVCFSMFVLLTNS